MINISKFKKLKIKFLAPVSLYSYGLTILTLIPFWLVLKVFNLHGYCIIAFLPLNLVIQTWMYKTKGLKNSQFVDKKWLKKTHKMTPPQLDKYMTLNFWGYGLMKVVFIILLIIFPHKETAVVFLPFYFVGFILIKAMLARFNFIVFPKGFVKATTLYVSHPIKSRTLDLALASQGTYYMKKRH
ncbi:MAG: hypothetical protein WCG05_04345 [Alphaproteobacteria bacterium]